MMRAAAVNTVVDGLGVTDTRVVLVIDGDNSGWHIDCCSTCTTVCAVRQELTCFTAACGCVEMGVLRTDKGADYLLAQKENGDKLCENNRTDE